MQLLAETGIKLEQSKRLLLIPARNFPIEILFLRDDDIPQSVADGVADIGIVGETNMRRSRRMCALPSGLVSAGVGCHSPSPRKRNMTVWRGSRAR